MNEKEFLRRLADDARDTVDLLSNPRKRERERRICAAFLRCAGIAFHSAELTCPDKDPPDVCFRNAAFEIKIILGCRKIHDEWKATAARRGSAQSIDDVLEPAVQPVPVSFTRLLQTVTEELEKQIYDPKTRASLDALLYVNLQNSFLDVSSEYPDNTVLSQKQWRSVSILFLPYAIVVTASSSAPDFLSNLVGTVQSGCHDSDRWFNL